VTLGDQPLIVADVIRRFVGEPVGTRAVYGSQPGHPVVLGREHWPAIEALRGDQGARPLLVGGQQIDCSTLAPGAGADVDTVDELHAVRRLLEA
jgi:CTP:molybdopterin cytidylyltransferase MocA